MLNHPCASQLTSVPSQAQRLGGSNQERLSCRTLCGQPAPAGHLCPRTHVPYANTATNTNQTRKVSHPLTCSLTAAPYCVKMGGTEGWAPQLTLGLQPGNQPGRSGGCVAAGLEGSCGVSGWEHRAWGHIKFGSKGQGTLAVVSPGKQGRGMGPWSGGLSSQAGWLLRGGGVGGEEEAEVNKEGGWLERAGPGREGGEVRHLARQGPSKHQTKNQLWQQQICPLNIQAAGAVLRTTFQKHKAHLGSSL